MATKKKTGEKKPFTCLIQAALLKPTDQPPATNCAILSVATAEFHPMPNTDASNAFTTATATAVVVGHRHHQKQK